ncbi:MAG: hypothetical protein WC807_07860 [Hyphomicrobium sp.]|jgi:hypothetical protein
MRALLLGLALLATLKIWVQDWAYRSATEHALIAAYRERAVAACQKAAPAAADTTPLGLAVDWSRQQDASITVGNSAVSVHIWDIQSKLWVDRYRKPYLILSAPDASLACAYDIDDSAAEICKL